MKEYFYVKGHLDTDYIEEVDTLDDHQIEDIEEECQTCFDRDLVMGTFKTLDEAKKIVNDMPYSKEFKQTMINEIKEQLEDDTNKK